MAAFADHRPDGLLARARQHLQPTGLTARFGGRIALTDGLIHHQDIRRALGILREVPAERVLAALRFAPGAPPIGAAKRVRGLSFVATDLDWITGKGPAVEGPGEALLMAMAGRPAALPELSGPGTPTPVGVPLGGEPADVIVDLGVQSLSEHPAGALADASINDLRQRRRDGGVRGDGQHRAGLPGVQADTADLKGAQRGREVLLEV